METKEALATAEIIKLRLEVQQLQASVLWWQNLYMAAVMSALVQQPESHGPNRMQPSRN